MPLGVSIMLAQLSVDDLSGAGWRAGRWRCGDGGGGGEGDGGRHSW